MSSEWWNDEERRALLLSVGGGRQTRPLTPLQVAELLARAISLGATASGIAQALHLDGTSMIGRFLSLRRLPANVQDEVGWGRGRGSLNLTQAQEIARLPDLRDQSLLALSVVEHNMSGAEVRSVVQLVRDARDTCARATEKTLALRPELQRRHVLLGSIRDLRIQRRLAGMSDQVRRDLVSELIPADALSFSLSPTHFSVSTTAAVGNADKFEAKLNNFLEAKLGGGE